MQFSAGYSGYEGTFIAWSYSTVNLLGTGESLELMAQYGKRIKNYSFSFTVLRVRPAGQSRVHDLRPLYVLSRPLYPKVPGSQSKHRVQGEWVLRSSVTYGYENIAVGPTSGEEDASAGGYYNPYYYGGTYGYGDYRVASLSTALYRSTVDSPWRRQAVLGTGGF